MSQSPKASAIADHTREKHNAHSEEESSLDRKQTLAIWLNQLAQGVYITLPYTLAVYMVRHFEGNSGNEESIGRNTGLLAATASIAQFMTSFMWGSISDHIGRKPVLMVGNISACLSILALGLAPNYKVAILSRFIGGLFTSSTGVAIKTIIGEACDATNQAKVMGYMTAGWGVGTIVGPTLGGLLARPCEVFASGLAICHEGSWFAERPFLLPCLVSAVMAFLAWLSNLFMMSETHPRFRNAQYTKLGLSDEAAPPNSLKHMGVRHSTSRSAHHEVQMSQLNQQGSTSAKYDSRNVISQHAVLPSHSDRSISVPAERGNLDILGATGHLSSSDHDAQQSQPQLTASDSSSSSSGILAVRSASSPLDSIERTDHERHQAQHAQRATRPWRAPSFELVLAEAGGDSDMGAYPAALEVAAEKAKRANRHKAMHLPKSPASTAYTPWHKSPHKAPYQDVGSEDESETEGLLLHGPGATSQDGEAEDQEHVVDISLPEESEQPWYKQKIVNVCLGAGGLIVVCMNYLDELGPIFASAQPSAGGLGMPENEFAWPLTFGGVVLMLYSLFLYPQNQKRWGHLTCCKIGLLLSIPASFVFPAASMFVGVRWLAQSLLFLAVGIRSIAKIMALSSSTIIVNTVAPMKQIGAVNGASQTLNALARAIGPFVAGILWGLSADSSIAGKQYLPFLGSIVGVLATYVLYMFIVLPSK